MINARIHIPGSKSITNRALLLAALADGVSELRDILISDDTLAFVEALKQLGILLQLDARARTCRVSGAGGVFPRREAAIACREAGTVARFLLAACAASPGRYHFSGAPRLQCRPLAGLIAVLQQQGARFEPVDAVSMPLTVYGVEALQGGDIVVPSGETGQYASALLMIAPFAAQCVTLQTPELVSRPYVQMTCNMMADFGVMVEQFSETVFSVPVTQRYQAREYRVEPDLSTASYFFAAAALMGGDVTIQSVDRQHTQQGDVAFLSVLEMMGCQVIASAAGLTVKGASILRGVDVDMRDFSDTFMTLAALAPFAISPTTITHIGHTRQQESDRIQAMTEGLVALGVKVDVGADWMTIYPSVPTAGKINSQGDHRIAMAFSVVGLRVAGIEIEGAACVAKTCPDFFTLWDSLVA